MNFQDKFTRWHHKPIVEPRQYSSNNGWIYSAECKAAGLSVDRNSLIDCYWLSKTMYGFRRHPDQAAPPISHDEVLGLIYLLGQGDNGPAIIEIWEKQYWQICDLDGFEPTSLYKLNWFGVIRDFCRIYKESRAEGISERHVTLRYPRVFPIAFRMGGWKRYLIKRHGGVKPTMYETLSFFFSKLYTIYTKPDSGTRILGFQLLMLEDKTFLEKVLAKLFNKRHNLKEVAASEYHPSHPILEKL